jgi:hypothetical protein
MSDFWMRVIPTVPGWLPSEDAAEVARQRMVELCPGARAVSAMTHDSVEFIDQGANLLAVRCPVCGSELDGDWWGAAMGEAAEGEFTDLAVTAPCCGTATSLNDLAYDWPAGFARFELNVEGPDRSWLTEQELGSVAVALGHPVRQILRHL